MTSEELERSPSAAQDVRAHWNYITEIPDSEKLRTINHESNY